MDLDIDFRQKFLQSSRKTTSFIYSRKKQPLFVHEEKNEYITEPVEKLVEEPIQQKKLKCL